MIYIRTDANDTIATGHVMRCLTVAEQLKVAGEDVCFIVSDEDSLTLIDNNRYQVQCIHTYWNDLDNTDEYEAMCRLINTHTDKLLIDSYSITPQYVKYMKQLTKVICFDDMGEALYPADIIINYNLYYSIFQYEKRYKEIPVRFLLGGKYVPLRSQFIMSSKKLPVHCRNNKKGEMLRILLICGGGDPMNMMGNFMRRLQEKNDELMKKAEWHIVVGAYNRNKSELEQYANIYININVHSNVSDMAELMSQCDICISAASTVLYECCAMQIPTIFFVVADNQKYDALYFGKDNLMLYAGDYRMEPENVLDAIMSDTEKLMIDGKLRQKMCEQMHDIVDGRGAERIAEAIIEL